MSRVFLYGMKMEEVKPDKFAKVARYLAGVFK